MKMKINISIDVTSLEDAKQAAKLIHAQTVELFVWAWKAGVHKELALYTTKLKDELLSGQDSRD